jgi:hypothetical protein
MPIPITFRVRSLDRACNRMMASLRLRTAD